MESLRRGGHSKTGFHPGYEAKLCAIFVAGHRGDDESVFDDNGIPIRHSIVRYIRYVTQ